MYIVVPILQLVLHVQVIEDNGIAELNVLHSLLQREAIGVEGYQAVAQRPLLHWLVENGVLIKDDDLNVVLNLQPLQNVLHRRRRYLCV